jgi:hypothetical protein
LVVNAIRNGPGSRAAALTNPPSGVGIVEVMSRNSAASSTVRASGPMTSRPHHAPVCGWMGTRSRCGLMPNSPFQVAGIRMEPMPSEPSAIAARPAPTAAPLPPLLPPGAKSGFHGLRVAPKVTVSVNGQIIISGTAVLPRITAPASRSSRTTSESDVRAGPCALLPKVVTSPATSESSLMAMGTPSSGDRSPESNLSCASAASRRAASARTTR